MRYFYFFCLSVCMLFSLCAEETDYEFFGYHLILNYLECDKEKLSDVEALKKVMYQAVESSHATVLKSVDYVFAPDGLTMVLLLSESHASIHTYPEHGSCFVDFFTCGRTCSAEKFDHVLQEYLQPHVVNSHLIRRDEKISEVHSLRKSAS